MTGEDIEAFLDGLIPLQIEQADIAGAVVTVVKDGRVLFAKGYGFADAEARTPVSPETTLFRTGSVTKLFTWTSVMQLVEQGKLDLDADVNRYLDFKLPQTHGVPVTLRHLMTHRGGFQETLKNLGAQRSGHVDLAGYVRNNIPDQIYKPGTTPSYSNYGAALAGYIVERVAGVPFDQYVETNIHAPLGMRVATLRTPLPADLAAQMSKGYVLASGAAGDFEVVNGYPAGSQSASGLAMGRFMAAVGNGGELDGKRILKADTIKLMRTNVLPPSAKVDLYGPSQEGIGFGMDFAIVMDPQKADTPQGLNTFYWGGAFGTWFWIDPTNDLVFVGMIQNLNGSTPTGGTPPVRAISPKLTYGALTDPSK